CWACLLASVVGVALGFFADLVEHAAGQLDVLAVVGALAARRALGAEVEAQDVLDGLVHVDRLAAQGARGVHAVLAVDELDDGARGVAHGAVILDLQVLQRVDQAALHVAGPARAHGGVHEAFAATHGVEEELQGREAALVRVLHEALGLGAQVAHREVGERAAMIAARDALAAHGLLAHAAGHLGEVEHGAAGAGLGHDDRAVLQAEVRAGDLAGFVTRLSKLLHDLELQRLLQVAAGKLLEDALVVGVDELVDGGAGVLDHLVDLGLRFGGDVLVVDAGAEALDHDAADGELRHVVDEAARAVGPVAADDLVEDLALEGADGLLVAGAVDQQAVLDGREAVVRAHVGGDLALDARVGLLDLRLELQRQVLGEDVAEELLAVPEVLAGLGGERAVEALELGLKLLLAGLGVGLLEVREPRVRDGGVRLLPGLEDVGALLVARLVPDARLLDLGDGREDLALGEEHLAERRDERARDLVVDGADDGAAEAGRQDVLLDAHEDLGLGARLLALEDVHVHLVAVEVRVVGRAHREVDAERLPRHDLDLVRHHRHAVQRGLAVEQHDVAVHEVALDHEAGLEALRHLRGVDVRDLEAAAVGAEDVVDAGLVDAAHAGGGARAAGDQLLDLLVVVRRDLDGDRQFARGLHGDAHVVDADVGVGRDHRAGAEVDALAGEVAAEAALLALEALGERLEGAARAVARGRDARRLVVHVRRDVVLEQLPEVFDDELGRAGVAVLLEALVDAQHVHELVREVVLRALARLQRDAGAHRHGRDREDGEDHPLGARDDGVDAHEGQVGVGHLLQPLADVHGRELVAVLAEGRGLLEVHLLGRLAAVRASVLGLRGLLDDLLHEVLVTAKLLGLLLLALKRLHLLGGEQHAAARLAGGAEDVLDDLREPDVDDGHREVDVAEVAGAVAHGAAARLAAQARLDDAQARVHEAHLDGVAVVVVGVGGDDLGRRHLADLLGREEGERDAPDLLGS